jgi:hypothetical protein
MVEKMMNLKKTTFLILRAGFRSTNYIIGLFGLRLTKSGNQLTTTEVFEDDFVTHANFCKPFTLTTTERLYALYKAVHFVVSSGVSGDFVECGVWKGGSVMMMALTLKSLGITDRTIHLFDTFAGMTQPMDIDANINGISGKNLLDRGDPNVWAIAPMEEVRSNLARTGYPMERFVFVPGDVSKTLPEFAPTRIALLRLDTDWYESTRHELEHLFPRLQARGVLIIDDYGHYIGARKAVDEYFEIQSDKYLMLRIDYTGRILMKA